jgi:hypothetical protein
MVKCPYCNYEGEFKFDKAWKFRFYDVKRIECPKCNGVFNYYKGISSKGKTSEFVIRIKSRSRG